MSINDGSPEPNLPLSDPDDEARQPGAFQNLRMAIVVLAAGAAGLGVVVLARPATRLVVDATAALIGKPLPRPDAPQQVPTFATGAGTPALAEVAPREDIAAAPAQADAPPVAATGAPATDGLLQKFQAWAADQDGGARASAEPAPSVEPASSAEPTQTTEAVQTAESVPAPDVPNRVKPRAPVRIAPKPRSARSARSFQNARAEIRSVRGTRRPKSPHAERAPADTEPEELAQAPRPPAQTADRPSLLQFFGLH